MLPAKHQFDVIVNLLLRASFRREQLAWYS